jgi:uncharacterized protein YodC (DUF2158 family)
MEGMMEFAIGDVVQLKSGGPRMTVEEIVDRCVTCSWFDKEQKKGQFNPATLTRASDLKSVVVRPTTSWVQARQRRR